MPEIAGFTWDSHLAEWDIMIHGSDPWTMIPERPAFTRFVQWVYMPLWLSMLACISFYITVFSDENLKKQYIKTFLFCWIVLGNVVASTFMSAGPIFFDKISGSDRFYLLTSYLESTRGQPFSSIDVADHLWHMQSIGSSSEGTGISAFPSLHVAMATLWAVTLPRVEPRLLWPAIALLILIQIGSVHLGWHYAIDGYVSIIATIAAWKVFGAGQMPRT